MAIVAIQYRYPKRYFLEMHQRKEHNQFKASHTFQSIWFHKWEGYNLFALINDPGLPWMPQIDIFARLHTGEDIKVRTILNKDWKSHCSDCMTEKLNEIKKGVKCKQSQDRQLKAQLTL